MWFRILLYDSTINNEFGIWGFGFLNNSVQSHVPLSAAHPPRALGLLVGHWHVPILAWIPTLKFHCGLEDFRCDIA